MICRARPKYLQPEDIPHILSGESVGLSGIPDDEASENAFYFNSGSLGFEFFLRSYNAFYKKTANVAIQSFTCRTMLDAIVRSGSTACIFDVKLEDASLSFSEVEGEDVDVIVLTNYQGIPNQEYLKFSAYCEKHGILLFDDLSHGTQSWVDGIKVGSLSNAYMESYTFDKPCSAMRGGKLVLSRMNSEFIQYFRTEYEKLPHESEFTAQKDLQTLSFLMRYTLPENYFEDFDYSIFNRYRQFTRLWNRHLFQIKFFRKALFIVFKIINRLSGPQARPSCQRIGAAKKRCVALQAARYSNQQGKQADYRALLGFCQKNSFEKPNTVIVWNRYSIIDADGTLEKQLRHRGLCVGHYNWSAGLHEYAHEYEGGKVVLRTKGYQNTDYLKTHILNIPIWQYDL